MSRDSPRPIGPAVLWLPELIKYFQVAPLSGQIRAKTSLRVHCRQISAQAIGHGQINLALQQCLLPDNVICGKGFHRKQIVVPVLEQHLRNHTGRQQGFQQTQHPDFSEDAVEAADPFRFRSQLRPRLLDNEVLRTRSRDSQHNVGDSPSQHLHLSMLQMRNVTTAPQVIERIVSIQLEHLFSRLF